MVRNLAKTLLAVPFLLSGAGVAHSAEFGVFADVGFSGSDAEGENSQFALGALDFFGTAQIDDNTRVFVEYVFEGGDDGLVTDLERLWVTRTISDALTVGVGRFHSPLGYWNRTYHHGAILQDTISRPFFLDFEDGSGAILPVHIVGLLASGHFYFSSGDLSYEAYVANGPSIDTSTPEPSDREIEINDAADPNANKTVGFRTTYSPGAVDLAVSFFAMSSMIGDSGNDGADLVSQTITGVDVTYQLGELDFMAEYYNLNNKDETLVVADNLGTQTAHAYYVQLGYAVADAWKLSIRHEGIASKKNKDRYFEELGVKDATQNVVAVRYDLDDTNTLKFEVKKYSPEDDAVEDITAYGLQWSFLIP